MRYAISKNGVTIRLPDERWLHITESHDYMSGLSDTVLEAVNSPEMIFEGTKNSLLAVKRYKNRYLIVAYKEIDKEDGFIITAFITSKIEKIQKKRRVLWKKK